MRFVPKRKKKKKIQPYWCVVSLFLSDFEDQLRYFSPEDPRRRLSRVHPRSSPGTRDRRSFFFPRIPGSRFASILPDVPKKSLVNVATLDRSRSRVEKNLSRDITRHLSLSRALSLSSLSRARHASLSQESPRMLRGRYILHNRRAPRAAVSLMSIYLNPRRPRKAPVIPLSVFALSKFAIFRTATGTRPDHARFLRMSLYHVSRTLGRNS